MRTQQINSTSGQSSNNYQTSSGSGAAAGFKRSKKRQAAPGGPGAQPGATTQTTGLAQVIFPPDSRRPCFCCYDQPFLVGNQRFKEGVYYHFLEIEKDALGNEIEVPVDRWICSVLKVLCIVRTDSSNEHSYLIEYIAHGETLARRAVLSQALLLGRPEEALKVLRGLGVSVLFHNMKAVRSYLDSQHLRFSAQTPDDFWCSVKVVGWAPAPTCFVLPAEIIGPQRGVWFDGKGDLVQYSKAGDFARWQMQVAARCDGNSYLMLALSIAFAGPLLEPLNIPGIGCHFFGESTTGKTTALIVASSVWSSPKFMMAWRTTLNGLEIQAANRSSTLQPVDESHEVEPKVLDPSVYMLLNGVSKARMNRDTSPREILRWRACVLSSGERSIETHQTAAGIDHKVGQTVRMIDIPVALGTHGLFSHLHGYNTGAEFSDALRAAAATHYGHAAPRFIGQLIKNFAGLSLSTRLPDTLKNFGNDLNAQDTRVARSFALAALAGELAIEWRIIPWQTRSALLAAVEIFRYWRATQPQSEKNKEHVQILDGARDFLETRAADFSDADWLPQHDPLSGKLINPEPVIHDRAGYWKEIGGKRIYLFNAEGLKRASSGFGTRKAAEVLDAAGALIDKDSGKRTKKVWIPELKRRGNFYMVDPEKLELNP